MQNRLKKFDNPETALDIQNSAEPGLWFFILGDMIIFALFFGTFLYYRTFDIELFRTSKDTLNQNLGTLNTLLLLFSSWCVASAIEQLRKDHTQTIMASRLFTGALACGLGFSAIKYIEYSAKIGAGITPLTNEFYMYYFILTGVHFIHLLFGLIVLSFMILKVRNGATKAEDIRNYESGGAYWHMVDLLWIILFPLLYLLP